VSPRLSDLLLSSQSDERLVSLARTGHERAFAVIVERYRAELQALARRLDSDGRSEDVVQQAFLSAFIALRSGSEVRHLRGWLYQIVRNAAVRPQAPPSIPLERATASAPALEDVVQQRALAMSALSEIARLPARQRQAMIGTALDGRPRAEIARSMGLSEGAVRQLVHRARSTLRSGVTAVTPWPLARWVAALGPDAPGPAELAAGAGAASSGGLALKLGALLASAVPVALVPGRPAGPPGVHAGTVHAARHPERHKTTRGGSGERGDAQPGDRHDDGSSSRNGGEDSRGGSGRDGNGGAAVRSSGAGSHGQDGGGDDGTGHDGSREGGSSSDGSRDGGSSSGGSDGDDSAQMASTSDSAGSAFEGSGSHRDSGGSGSREASKGSAGSGSDGGSGSGDGSGSGSGGGSGSGYGGGSGLGSGGGSGSGSGGGSGSSGSGSGDGDGTSGG
jgi:RNA polymerase sigma factor (sigma-70 family)